MVLKSSNTPLLCSSIANTIIQSIDKGNTMCTAVMDVSKKRSSGKQSKKAKKQPAKYKKAPGAPR